MVAEMRRTAKWGVSATVALSLGAPGCATRVPERRTYVALATLPDGPSNSEHERRLHENLGEANKGVLYRGSSLSFLPGDGCQDGYGGILRPCVQTIERLERVAYDQGYLVRPWTQAYSATAKGTRATDDVDLVFVLEHVRFAEPKPDAILATSVRFYQEAIVAHRIPHPRTQSIFVPANVQADASATGTGTAPTVPVIPRQTDSLKLDKYLREPVLARCLDHFRSSADTAEPMRGDVQLRLLSLRSHRVFWVKSYRSYEPREGGPLAAYHQLDRRPPATWEPRWVPPALMGSGAAMGATALGVGLGTDKPGLAIGLGVTGAVALITGIVLEVRRRPVFPEPEQVLCQPDWTRSDNPLDYSEKELAAQQREEGTDYSLSGSDKGDSSPPTLEERRADLLDSLVDRYAVDLASLERQNWEPPADESEPMCICRCEWDRLERCTVRTDRKTKEDEQCEMVKQRYDYLPCNQCALRSNGEVTCSIHVNDAEPPEDSASDESSGAESSTSSKTEAPAPPVDTVDPEPKLAPPP